jgi:hypothetical protein
MPKKLYIAFCGEFGDRGHVGVYESETVARRVSQLSNEGYWSGQPDVEEIEVNAIPQAIQLKLLEAM